MSVEQRIKSVQSRLRAQGGPAAIDAVMLIDELARSLDERAEANRENVRNAVHAGIFKSYPVSVVEAVGYTQEGYDRLIDSITNEVQRLHPEIDEKRLAGVIASWMRVRWPEGTEIEIRHGSGRLPAELAHHIKEAW